MSKFPHLLLKKRTTTSSLSQNLFSQLQAKGEWLIVLESLKRKKTNKQKGAFTSLNKQTRLLLWSQTNKQGCFYELNRIYICGVHLGLLPQTSPGGTCLPSLSLPVLVRLLPQGDLGLYLYLYLFYCACMFNSYRICARNLYDVPTCSIPIGYVHEICMMCLHVQLPMDMCTSSVFFLSDLYGVLCVHVQFPKDMCMNFVFFLSDLYKVSCLHV